MNVSLRKLNTTRYSSMSLFSFIYTLLYQQLLVVYQLNLGLKRYSHNRYTIDTEINRYLSIQSSSFTDTDDCDSRKNNYYSGIKIIISHLTFIQQSKIPKDARSVSLYPYNRSQIWQYVKGALSDLFISYLSAIY